MASLRFLRPAIATGMAVIVFYYVFFRPTWQLQDPIRKAAQTSDDDFILDKDILEALEVSAQVVNFQRLCMNATEKHGLHRQSIIDVDSSRGLLVHKAFHKLAVTLLSLPPCQSVHQVEVPEFESLHHVSTAQLMLGVATTTSRIKNSLSVFSRWLPNTGTTLVCVLIDQDDLDDDFVAGLHSQAAALSIDLILEPLDRNLRERSDGVKNFGLSLALMKNRREETRWFGVIDDDTFFLSLPRMLEALAPYNPEKSWYIGGLSETFWSIAMYNIMAWGGAGIFISVPLMHTIKNNFRKCLATGQNNGDGLWRDCIIEATSPSVPLTEMHGLHQLDFRGDVSGWYEGGFEEGSILTVHHWMSYHTFPVAVAHLVADVAGPDSLFQRYRFGNTVFTNGFSIVEYPRGLPDLNIVELTMNDGSPGPQDQLQFWHSIGRTRPALPREEKISWEFKHSVKEGDVVRQFYVKKTGRGREGGGDEDGEDNKGDEDVHLVEIDWRYG